MRNGHPRITGKQPFYSSIKWLVFSALYFFFRRYKYVGLKNIPRDKPVIFAVNHQNAFLDALVIAPSIPFRQLTFMLRASIYNNKKAWPLLRGLNLLPVYRTVDGKDQVEKNDVVFENCVFLLEHKRPILIFPEGTHNDVRSIRPAKKGLARIVFQAEEKHNFALDIHIVPVGLTYSDPYNFGSDLLVNFGKPIRVIDYKSQYLENPTQTMNKLRLDVDRTMRDLAIDISSDFYPQVEVTCSILTNDKVIGKNISLYDEFVIAKQAIELVQANETGGWKEDADEYERLSKEMNIRDYMLNPSYKLPGAWLHWLFIVAGFPFFVAGALLNAIPFRVPVMVSRKVVRDKVFNASIIYVVAMVLFPVYYIILFTTVGLIFSWALAGLVLLTAMITGLAALLYLRKWKKLNAWMRLKKFRSANDHRYTKAVELRNRITDFFRDSWTS